MWSAPLRLSSRPPDPAARFSAELATRLRDAASAAMSPGTPEPQWLAVLQAVVESPVRRTVRPEGLPANPSAELLDTARQQCGRVPALAPLLGISVPPPPARHARWLRPRLLLEATGGQAGQGVKWARRRRGLQDGHGRPLRRRRPERVRAQEAEPDSPVQGLVHPRAQRQPRVQRQQRGDPVGAPSHDVRGSRAGGR